MYLFVEADATMAKLRFPVVVVIVLYSPRHLYLIKDAS